MLRHGLSIEVMGIPAADGRFLAAMQAGAALGAVAGWAGDIPFDLPPVLRPPDQPRTTGRPAGNPNNKENNHGDPRVQIAASSASRQTCSAASPIHAIAQLARFALAAFWSSGPDQGAGFRHQLRLPASLSSAGCSSPIRWSISRDRPNTGCRSFRPVAAPTAPAPSTSSRCCC